MRKYAIILILILFSCKVKKDTSITEIETIERIQESNHIESNRSITEISKLKEVQIGNTIIIPKGNFTFFDGKFEGEAESIVINNEISTESETEKIDTTLLINHNQINSDFYSNAKQTDKIIEKKPVTFMWLAWIGMILFLIWIVWRIILKL
ncbi:hypothetical protein [Flavobacterium sp.]|uniref:hypothetical protein n=1 Tax=Flavobacterium sp. TaxID=239 RepID=UPI003F6A0C41